jgi:hypothetical protein
MNGREAIGCRCGWSYETRQWAGKCSVTAAFWTAEGIEAQQPPDRVSVGSSIARVRRAMSGVKSERVNAGSCGTRSNAEETWS